ncbi:MAG: group III truncated hemoglobin [Cyclobacteriaceae bacterium]|nr:group III truncated hemoglobin [Cyclobacteriaceae bacterium]
MGTPLPDIQNREDVQLLVDRFYDQVRRDSLLFPVFAHVDWPAHLPTMYNFWSSILLGDGSYLGNPFQKHIGLAISGEHFDRWLELFTGTVRGNFEGARADEAVARANSIAMLFRHRLGIELPE